MKNENSFKFVRRDTATGSHGELCQCSDSASLAQGLAEGLAQGLTEGLAHNAQGLSPPALRTSLREALDLRIADFKGCVLLPLLLLLFEKPSAFCRRRLTPEIEFSNSFRGL